MTKKHFIELADQIKEFNLLAKLHDEPEFNEAQIHALAVFCAHQNPNFNRTRWLDYIAGKCGKSGGKAKEIA